MKKNSEIHIHIYLVSFLKKLQLAGLDFVVFHVPNGEARSKRDGGKLKMMGVIPGVPDLCVMLRDKVFFIELKASAGRPSTAQEEFIQDARRYGHKTYIVKAATPHEAVLKAVDIFKEYFDSHQTISSLASSFISKL